jgi:hypothetical protein
VTRPSARRSTSSLAGAVTLVLLVSGATPAPGASPAGSALQVARDTTPVGDLRCLTSREEHCLPEPVPADEPHGAICATCHDLWRHDSLSEARATCASGECHTDPRSLAPFHRTIDASLLESCVECHDPHDARMPDGGDDCSACHESAGRRVAWVEDVRPGRARPGPMMEPAFEHASHPSVDCVACHGTGSRHGVVDVVAVEDCRACHHAEPASADCLGCHADERAHDTPIRVRRTLDIHLGGLDGPTRDLPYDHALHADVACGTCHVGSRDLEGSLRADCSSCHDDHHSTDADCTSCHEAPADGAHDATAHLGCGGTGCHVRAPASVIEAPRTRSLCLACHQDLAEHKPERDCNACHILPPPRG